jgi:hypothetical protein
MKRWLLAVTATMLTLPVFGASPYVGTWAQRQKLCLAEGDSVPMKIREQEILFYESGCNLKSIVRNASTWTAKAECSGEGESWSQSIRMTVSGNSLIFSMGNGKDERYVRCR